MYEKCANFIALVHDCMLPHFPAEPKILKKAIESAIFRLLQTFWFGLVLILYFRRFRTVTYTSHFCTGEAQERKKNN
jgi:hypothetical protein